MKERPIIFSGEMVRAILDGRKTQTRRVVKPQPTWEDPVKTIEGEWMDYEDAHIVDHAAWECGGLPHGRKCPYGQPGDRLWVRETWWPIGGFWSTHIGTICSAEIRYRADDRVLYQSCPDEFKRNYQNPMGWRPSIHMPRWASRITLEVTDVRLERVQDITRDDAWQEGVSNSPEYDCVTKFISLWNLINAKRPGCSWDYNPWVWVINFRIVK